MKYLSQQQVNEILRKHKLYLNGERGGRMADFTNMSLTGIDLSNLNLRGVSFEDAELTHVNCSYSYLEWCRFDNAALKDVDFRYCNLSKASFYGAKIIWSDMSHANLTDINTRCMSIHSAKGIINLGYPNEHTAIAWLRDGRMVFRINSAEMRLADVRKSWARNPGGKEILAAAEYAAAVAKARKWKV